jgi:hypothetical protein
MPALDHPPAQGAESRGDAVAVAALLTAGAAYWWLILADPAGRIAGGNGDPLFLAYIVTWVASHLGDAALWNPPFFHPAPGVLAYSDHGIGLGVLSWPLVQAGVSPVAIVNLLSMAAAVSTSFALYAWLRATGFTAPAAAAAAMMVAYGAWRHLQIAHLQLQFTAFLPLALLCYSRAIAAAAAHARWAWLGGAALAAQTLMTPSLGIYIVPLVVVWLIAASAIAGRRGWRHWLRLADSLLVVAVVNLPIAWHYRRLGDALDRGVSEIARHSAAWVDWISAPPHWLYGEALAFTRGGERELFPGAAFMLVTVVGMLAVLRTRGQPRIAIAGLLTAALALWAATGLSPDGWSPARLPYEVFYRFMPGGAQVRVPVRFVLPAAIFLAPVVAAGWTLIGTAIARQRAGRWAPVVTLALAAIMTAEGLANRAWYEDARPLSPAGVPERAGTAAFVMVPLLDPRGEIARMWAARLAGVPIVNGYSGHPSPLYRVLGSLQASTLDAESQRALYALLRHDGVSTIVVTEPVPGWIDPARLLATAPGVYRIPKEADAFSLDRIVMSRGAGLVVTAAGWSYPERNDRESWVWSTSRRALLRIPLGGVRRTAIALRARSQSDGGDELEVWWGGRRLGVQPLSTSPAFLEFRLPESTGRSWIDLELRGPRPIHMPGNPDPRALSICLFEIRLE